MVPVPGQAGNHALHRYHHHIHPAANRDAPGVLIPQKRFASPFRSLKANDKNHPQEMQERFIASYRKRGGAIDAHTFDGLSEHRMVPSPDKPETMRFIETITAFIRRQTEMRQAS
jgi:hypothetical protein